MRNYWRNFKQIFKSGRTLATPESVDEGVFVFIRCWNRPLFLWSCLDSLYRHTRSKCKFVIIDNASTDPMVKLVIAGFQRRSMFYGVHFMPTNDGSNQEKIIQQYRSELGEFFFLLDADICISPGKDCWIANMLRVARRHPKLGLLGSCIDTSDFVSFAEAAALEPDLNEVAINELIKGKSVERSYTPVDNELINPFRPPGRLLLVKSALIDKIGVPVGNKRICDAAVKAGYEYGMTPLLIHRHLSLLNIFDYPDYDYPQLKKYLNKE